MFRVLKLAGIVGLGRELLPLAMLLMLVVPAYSQQEVDPTWYDPWTTASKAAVPHLQVERLADRAQRKKISSAAGTRPTKRKLRTQASNDRKTPRKVSVRN